MRNLLRPSLTSFAKMAIAHPVVAKIFGDLLKTAGTGAAAAYVYKLLNALAKGSEMDTNISLKIL